MGLDSGVKEWPLKSGLLYVRQGLFEPSVWTTKKLKSRYFASDGSGLSGLVQAQILLD